MKEKLYRAIFKGTNLFLVLLLIDYITTLFSLDESGVFVSKLGIVFEHTMTENTISTVFSVAPRLFIIYVVVLLVIFLIEMRKKNE